MNTAQESKNTNTPPPRLTGPTVTKEFYARLNNLIKKKGMKEHTVIIVAVERYMTEEGF